MDFQTPTQALDETTMGQEEESACEATMDWTRGDSKRVKCSDVTRSKICKCAHSRSLVCAALRANPPEGRHRICYSGVLKRGGFGDQAELFQDTIPNDRVCWVYQKSYTTCKDICEGIGAGFTCGVSPAR